MNSYNLCLIKKMGDEKFAKTTARKVRVAYFKRKLALKVMILYFALILFVAGLCAWIAGSVLFKRSAHLDKHKKKKQQARAMLFGTISKILMILAALMFVAGVMLIYGVNMSAK